MAFLGLSAAAWAAVGTAVSVAGAAYGAYSADQAQSQQAAQNKKNAELARNQEAAAGQARANQIQYDIDKRKKTFASSAAGAGVDVGSGSLLESIGRFGADAEYSKQLARYPYQLAGQSDQYKADVFGFSSKMFAGRALTDASIAGGSTLATAASRYGSKGFFNTGPNDGYNVQAP